MKRAAWWFALVLATVPLVARAQVAGLCGAGRRCTVSTLRATDTVSASVGTYSIRVKHNAGRISFCDANDNCNWLYLYNNASAGLIVESGGGAASLTTAQYVVATTGYSAPMPYASFPTCNSSTNGRLLYDSTNTVWRYCDGSGWAILATSPSATPAETWSSVHVGSLATAQWSGAYEARTAHTQARLLCSGTTSGSGTGNVTVNVYDVTDATNRCSYSFSCATSAGTVRDSGWLACSVAAGNTFAVSSNITGCSATAVGNVQCNVVFE